MSDVHVEHHDESGWKASMIEDRPDVSLIEEFIKRIPAHQVQPLDLVVIRGDRSLTVESVWRNHPSVGLIAMRMRNGETLCVNDRDTVPVLA